METAALPLPRAHANTHTHTTTRWPFVAVFCDGAKPGLHCIDKTMCTSKTKRQMSGKLGNKMDAHTRL